jgi:hypothetical protein
MQTFVILPSEVYLVSCFQTKKKNLKKIYCLRKFYYDIMLMNCVQCHYNKLIKNNLNYYLFFQSTNSQPYEHQLGGFFVSSTQKVKPVTAFPLIQESK